MKAHPLKKSVVYIISDLKESISFQWILEALRDQDFRMSVILINGEGTSFQSHLVAAGFDVFTVKTNGKLSLPVAVFKVRRLLRKLAADVVHCHLLTANLVGLTAARLAGVKKRIYTRHHGSEHHMYHPSGVKLDRFCNSMATTVVAISESLKRILVEWEHVPPEKVALVPHGFKLSAFSDISKERIELLRKKYALGDAYPVVGVISRFVELKGIQYIIPAFRRLLQTHPSAVLLMMNATGDFSTQLNSMLDELPVTSIRKTGFENDIAGVYRLMDIFLHVPINDHAEAFGQIYVEALASGTPSIFTLSGIAPDFIRHEHNALVVPFEDEHAIYLAMQRLLNENHLRYNLRNNGPTGLVAFTFDAMISKLAALYD